MSTNYIKIKKSFLGVALLFLMLFPFLLFAQTVFFDPGSININLNTQFSLPLKINDVQNLFAVNFDLNFDPNLLEYVSTQEGDFLKQGCNTAMMVSPSSGKIIFGLTRLSASCGGVSGSGTIATFNFRSKSQNGIAALTFSNNSLCILNGTSCNYITGTWNPATVTIGNPDTTPPVISNSSPVGTLPAGTTQTTMSVVTNENATCRYSTTAGTAYSSMTNTFSTTGGTSHSATITGLTNGQTYYRYVRCQDTAGNANTSDYTITFSVASSDTTPPIISLVTASDITSSGATVTWATNESSDSQVEYGLTTSYGSQTTLNSSMVTSHSQALAGLSANTTYHYRIKSRDAAGNLAVSQDYSFSTADEDSSLCNSGSSAAR